MPRKSPRPSGSKRNRSSRPSGPASGEPMRLQRLLASAGFGSRRQCEELIEAGRVDIDGEVITQLGTTVEPTTQKVRVDGVPLKKQKLVYYAVNKPVGFVTTNRDPQGRPRVIDLVPRDERVFPVGRLDRSSEGLILLTNDGELAQKLTHPKFGVRKVYRVTVAGKVEGETMKKMRQGIYIAEGFVKVEGAKVLKTRSRATEMEIILREGKNREIRRILARLGHKVQQLRRIAVGPLKLGDVPSGAYRAVSRQEVEKLWAATELAAAEETKDARDESFGGKNAGTGKRSPGKRSPGKRGIGKGSTGKLGGKDRGTKRKRAGDSLRAGKGARGDRDRNDGAQGEVTRDSSGGRRQVKKSRPTRPPASGEFTFNLGESRSSGAIIGGEPAPAAEQKGEPRRATKKRSTPKSRPASGTRSEGDRENVYKRGGKGGGGKKFPSKGGSGKPPRGAKKKRRKH